MTRKGASHVELVSAHGGHSGQFCQHATDTLEDIILAYIRKGFSWVGITEHMPPTEDRWRYRDEQEAGLSARFLYDRFADYMIECRRLQEKYRSSLRMFAGMETEIYPGATDYIRQLRREFSIDYIVGSIHHVDGVNFDGSAMEYETAVNASGGVIPFYRRYFDIQYEMLQELKPDVVGHFDLVRLFDPDYGEHLSHPDIRSRIERNLKLVSGLGLILDVNVRALVKGAGEPYPTRWILEQAGALGIAAVPGDDSHGLDTVGLYIETAVGMLAELGFDTRWQPPAGRP